MTAAANTVSQSYNRRAPYALRAAARFAFSDLVFLMVAVPGAFHLGVTEVLAFLAGVAWAVPPEQIPEVLGGLMPRGRVAKWHATCAVSLAAPMCDGADPDPRMVGFIERFIR